MVIVLERFDVMECAEGGILLSVEMKRRRLQSWTRGRVRVGKRELRLVVVDEKSKIWVVLRGARRLIDI